MKSTTAIQRVLSAREFKDLHGRFSADIEQSGNADEMLACLLSHPWQITTEQLADFTGETQLDIHRFRRDGVVKRPVFKYRMASLLAFLNLVQEATGQDIGTPGWNVTKNFLTKTPLSNQGSLKVSDFVASGQSGLIYEVVVGRMTHEDAVHKFRQAVLPDVD